jgi:hypothetical protein
MTARIIPPIEPERLELEFSDYGRDLTKYPRGWCPVAGIVLALAVLVGVLILVS